MPADTSQPVVAFHRVRLMVAQMLVVVFATGSIFFVPMPYGATLMALLYGALLYAERTLSVRSPLTIGVFALSLLVWLAQILVDPGAYGLYTATLYYGLLFAIGAVCLAWGQPLSRFYSGGLGLPALHWMTSVFWVLLYAAGLTLSLLIPRYPSLFIWLVVLPLAGVLVTLWLQLVDMGPRYRRCTAFHVGGFDFSQLKPNREALQPFYEHFVREASHSLKQGKDVRGLSFEQVLELKMASDTAGWADTLFFVARDGEAVIGTISCTLRTADAQLGVEAGIREPLYLDALERHGRILEVGRFSINAKYRMRKELVQGLLRAVVEYAFEQDVPFLIAQAYPGVVPIYTKIGFELISDKVVEQTGTGAPVMLLVFNLARRAICEEKPAQVGASAEVNMSPYLEERFFKRQSLFSLFNGKQPWAVSNAQLTELCLTVPSNQSSGVRTHGA